MKRDYTVRNLKHFPLERLRENSKMSPFSSRSKERFKEESVEKERRRGKNLSKNETERPNHAARPGLARPIAPSLRKDEQKRHHFVLQSNANVVSVTTGRDRGSGRARGREHL